MSSGWSRSACGGRPVSLTAKEFALLAYICERRGKSLSHPLLAGWDQSLRRCGPRTVDIRFVAFAPRWSMRSHGNSSRRRVQLEPPLPRRRRRRSPDPDEFRSLNFHARFVSWGSLRIGPEISLRRPSPLKAGSASSVIAVVEWTRRCARNRSRARRSSNRTRGEGPFVGTLYESRAPRASSPGRPGGTAGRAPTKYVDEGYRLAAENRWPPRDGSVRQEPHRSSAWTLRSFRGTPMARGFG